MIRGFAVLLVYQLAGEAIVRAASLSFPGPVVGMALLLLTLELRGGEAGEGLRAVSSGLLGHLSILFVPAGVGVMLHARRLADEWPALLAGLLLSTAAAVAVTGFVGDRLRRGDRTEVRS